ncbi:hypothetical protein HNQ93_000480 [Hymenobacter luteus]|uniref:Uncharacterized protein n=2 Tax=Hymenobacter TaxID=89966 RepID=A0A7W9WAT0_9BACT|nr:MULTISPECIES: hypothetical protein [Hymenobacter]MBB4600040.1 hypothetical protein [Hymenobacter latericoloratus]MBB6057650.1 hypothetical protein [Hymenobacter luteus]
MNLFWQLRPELPQSYRQFPATSKIHRTPRRAASRSGRNSPYVSLYGLLHGLVQPYLYSAGQVALLRKFL